MEFVSKLTVGSLFAGIGGFDLGLERTGGFEIKWQVEIDEYCQRVLAKHWPHVKRYGDIRTVTDVERVDVLCGGFPCQDISNAGKRAGIDGERSGLWSEYVRIIRMVRPRYVLVENVSALLGRGMGRVLGDLSEIGYDAEWDVIRASDVGAPHRRERVWIIAYMPDANDPKNERPGVRGRILSVQPRRVPWQPSYAGIRRGNDGIPEAMDRLHALGNAVVPQIVEWIGNQILKHELSPVNSVHGAKVQTTNNSRNRTLADDQQFKKLL